MKVYEVLELNKELLKRIHSVGIKPGDYKFVELYNEYVERLSGGEKVTYIVASIALKYRISERQVYNIVKNFAREFLLQKPCSDKKG